MNLSLDTAPMSVRLWLHVGIGHLLSMQWSQDCNVAYWQRSNSAAPKPCRLRQAQQAVVMDAPPL